MSEKKRQVVLCIANPRGAYEFYKKILEEAGGFEVVIHKNVTEAKKFIRDSGRKIDFVVTSMNMVHHPEPHSGKLKSHHYLDGIQIIYELQELLPTCRFLLMGGERFPSLMIRICLNSRSEVKQLDDEWNVLPDDLLKALQEEQELQLTLV